MLVSLNKKFTETQITTTSKRKMKHTHKLQLLHITKKILEIKKMTNWSLRSVQGNQCVAIHLAAVAPPANWKSSELGGEAAESST